MDPKTEYGKRIDLISKTEYISQKTTQPDL
jgi:hypothetical protein